MNQHSHDVVTRLATLQTAINALSPSAEKTATQAAFNDVIFMLARAQAVGELRVGIELPAAS